MTGILLSLSLLLPPQTAQSGEAILKAVNEKLSAAKSVTGQAEVKFEGDAAPVKYDFKLMKPNLYVVASDTAQYRFDGENMWLYMPASKTYSKSPMLGAKTVSPPFLFGIDSFFHKGANSKVVSSEKTTFAEKPALSIVVEAGASEKINLYVDEASKLPVGWSQKLGETTQTTTYKNLKLDEPLTQEQFAWAPPADAKPFKAFDPTATMLAVGTAAPDFTLTGASDNFKFAQHTKGAKATIVFFFFMSDESEAHFKDLQKYSEAYSSQGLKVVAVNYGDPAEKVQEFKKARAVDFPVLSNGITDTVNIPQLYKVSFYPTTYVVGPDGKILSRFVQLDTEKLDAVLKSAGFTVK